MILIYVPCRDKAEAKSIGRALVGEKLAFCVNIIPKTTSFYFWEGKLEEGSEAALLVKTNQDYETVSAKIKELHSYEIPAIIELAVKNVNKEYVDWSQS
jgi:periplasmic divalent cation tolerance protein